MLLRTLDKVIANFYKTALLLVFSAGVFVVDAGRKYAFQLKKPHTVTASLANTVSTAKSCFEPEENVIFNKNGYRLLWRDLYIFIGSGVVVGTITYKIFT